MQDGNQPAFPVTLTGPCEAYGLEASETQKIEFHGMTLRDYFAAKAMQGYVLNEALIKDTDTQQEWLDLTAKTSYLMADAMLKARQE